MSEYVSVCVCVCLIALVYACHVTPTSSTMPSLPLRNVSELASPDSLMAIFITTIMLSRSSMDVHRYLQPRLPSSDVSVRPPNTNSFTWPAFRSAMCSSRLGGQLTRRILSVNRHWSCSEPQLSISGSGPRQIKHQGGCRSDV